MKKNKGTKKEVKNRECNVDSSKKVLLLHAE
jgi:hypothetical protein